MTWWYAPFAAVTVRLIKLSDTGLPKYPYTWSRCMLEAPPATCAPTPTTPPLTAAPHLIPHTFTRRVQGASAQMSDLQPTPDDALLRPQVTRWRADGLIGIDQRNADEQNGDLKGSSANGMSACEQSADGHSNMESRAWSRWDWLFARFQGTLPLTLSARIPLEVFRLVIEKMDRTELIVAALVCTAWHSRAMHNLYHTVEIRSRTSYNLLFKQCYPSPRVKQWLASTYKLVVYEGDDDVDNGLRFLQALPSALASLTPRVRTVHIRLGRLRFIRIDFFLALSRFKSVNSLTLQECHLNNITQLWRIVSAFPQLTDLTMMHLEFDQRGAASYAETSLFRPPSHIRLRRLHVGLDDEPMVMFLDRMAHSDLCTPLADLTIWSNDPSMALTPLDQLLETAGASLTRFCERFYDGKALTHGNLLQNTALESLEFRLQPIKHEAKYQGPHAAWTKATEEIYGIFSTVQSRQLEHIEVRVRAHVDDTILEPEQPGVVLERLDLRDLHEVMSQPYFDTLQDVKVTMMLSPRANQTKSDVDSIGQKLQAMFRGILQPWSARGIVTITRKSY
ncbi:uncharacterized protein B0H18DRAFT_1116249 [Fomitopsis serialis]|uniref:uncharacterized protein n=1 Tax=Fomitopsis serialis TaxID=139415 RepID=UPI002007E822|nr:uncharacterized protein B0H18DRAFT_1116249 [Neoantrodia serialis]KAH9931435.1 hypothetical protein B0H18DRAFT_1116249 [Neoantrodia serialis]